MRVVSPCAPQVFHIQRRGLYFATAPVSPGTFTFLIGTHYLILAPQNMLYPMILPLVGAMIVAGAAIDLLYARLQSTLSHRHPQQEDTLHRSDTASICSPS
jgi:hypothetical protein